MMKGCFQWSETIFTFFVGENHLIRARHLHGSFAGSCSFVAQIRSRIGPSGSVWMKADMARNAITPPPPLAVQLLLCDIRPSCVIEWFLDFWFFLVPLEDFVVNESGDNTTESQQKALGASNHLASDTSTVQCRHFDNINFPVVFCPWFSEHPIPVLEYHCSRGWTSRKPFLCIFMSSGRFLVRFRTCCEPCSKTQHFPNSQSDSGQ